MNVDAIQVLGEIEPDGDSWIERREICLKSKVWTNLTDLILEAKDPQKYTSLATFKPTKLLDFIIEPVTREWDEKKVQNIFESEKQMKMFAENTLSDHFKIVEKIPYKFSYRFEDEAGKRSKLMIEDWETCQLYRKMVLKYKDETIACQKVREKYWDDFALKKDLHFFLGTTLAYHKKNLKYPADNPFIIIGTFHPKPILNNPQTALF